MVVKSHFNNAIRLTHSLALDVSLNVQVRRQNLIDLGRGCWCQTGWFLSVSQNLLIRWDFHTRKKTSSEQQLSLNFDEKGQRTLARLI